MTTNDTHDPALRSWVEGANDPTTDFPIQNLPFGIAIMRDDDEESFETAVAIGDHVLLVSRLVEHGLIEGEGIDDDVLVALLYPHFEVLTTTELTHVRRALVGLLREDAPTLRDDAEVREFALRPMSEVEMALPAACMNYTDFYASLFHATNVGSMFRPDNPLLPNYKHIPIAYHGRASSIVPSGTPIRRPSGQTMPADGDAPVFGPCRLLDYELEVGIVIGRGNEQGAPIHIAEASDHIFGMCLVNDWSARDLQKWEYQPLGPFLAKSFATTMSPWIVTMEALAPFRCPAMTRPDGDPTPLAYLMDDDDQASGGVDLTLEVHLASKRMRDEGLEPVRLSRGSFKDMYWTISQMVAHHASNGCNLEEGDLLASGTVSGPSRDARGCLLELTWDGDPWASEPSIVPGTQRTPITLPTGEERRFLEDGDEIVIRGYCERDGFRRIGFGECRGVIEG